MQNQALSACLRNNDLMGLWRLVLDVIEGRELPSPGNQTGVIQLAGEHCLGVTRFTRRVP